MKIFVAGVTPAWSTSFTVAPANSKLGSKWLVMASMSARILDICVTGEAGMRHLQLHNVDENSLGSLRKMRAETIAQQSRSTCHAPLLDFEFFFDQAQRNIDGLGATGLISQDIIEDLTDHLQHSLEMLSPTAFAQHVREQGHPDILEGLYQYLTHPSEIAFWADYWSIIIGKIVHRIHVTA